MPIPTDTDRDTLAVLADIQRRMPVERKWLLLGETFATARVLHAAGVRLREPTADAARIHNNWLAVQFSYKGDSKRSLKPMGNLPVLRDVLRILTDLEIAHALGGSMASSLQGVARFTQDADVTVEPFPGNEERLVAALGSDYYVSLAAVQQAVAKRSSFNVLHTAEGFKVDLFVCKNEPFEESALRRRRELSFPDAPDQPVAVLSAEDIVLFKLQWYRLGDEVSERQWTDVLGVLRVQVGRLDEEYLDHWAAAIGVGDLLLRARAAASD